MMKNIYTYHFLILLPIPIFYWVYGLINTPLLVLLFAYFIYRGVIDGLRLISKGVLDQKEWWKAFVPFWTMYYFKELYFER